MSHSKRRCRAAVSVENAPPRASDFPEAAQWPLELASRLGGNAFVVLELDYRSSRSAIESRAQELLDALAIELPSAKLAKTPWGTRERDAVDVRHALHRLRDPDQRALEELDRLYLDELLHATRRLFG